MYPIIGMCMGCGEETYIMGKYCLNCKEKRDEVAKAEIKRKVLGEIVDD